MKKKYRLIILAILGVIVAGVVLIPTPRLILLGWLRAESFYLGRPTCWWHRELDRWQLLQMTDSHGGGSYLQWHREPTWSDQWLNGDRGTVASWGWDFLRSDLAVLHGDPESMPVLLELLGTGDRKLTVLALCGLGNIGPPARSVVPAVLELRDKSDRVVCEECSRAVWLIDPESAARARVRLPSWENLFQDLLPINGEND